MPKLKLSDNELNNIIADYNNGISMAQICKKYHHDKNTLKKYLQEHDVDIVLRDRSEALKISPLKEEADKEKRKYLVYDDYFSTQNSKMAYFLGFLMADGNVSEEGNRVQITLAELDSDYLEMYYKEIGGSPVAHYTQNNGKQQICRWQCLSAQIKRDLISYDVIPHKTGFAKIPQKLNKEFYADFIRGYFDGDGSIWLEQYNNAVGFGITSKNKEILEQIIDFFEEQGVNPVKIKTECRKNTNYSFKYRRTASEKIYKILYYDNSCLRMQRKFDKFTDIILKK